jgi:hypothetical protein
MAGLWMVEARIPSKEFIEVFDNLCQKENTSADQSESKGPSQIAPSP